MVKAFLDMIGHDGEICSLKKWDIQKFDKYGNLPLEDAGYLISADIDKFFGKSHSTVMNTDGKEMNTHAIMNHRKYQLFFFRVVMKIPRSADMFKAYLARAVGEEVNNPKIDSNTKLQVIHDHIYASLWL